MKSIYPHVLLVALLAPLLPGCAARERETRGTVFVATQSGENIRLGAVRIMLFDGDTIVGFVQSKQSEVLKEASRKSDELAAIEARLQFLATLVSLKEGLAAELNDAKVNDLWQPTSIARVLKFAQGQKQMIVEALRRLPAGYRTGDVESLYNDQIALMREEIDFATTAANRAVSLNERESVVQSRAASVNEALRCANQLHAMMAESLSSLKAVVPPQSRTGDSTSPANQDLDARVQSAKRASLQAIRQMSQLRDRLSKLIFENLPASALETTSGADGTYRINLPHEKRYALAAHTTRTIVRDVVENYYWFLWVAPDTAPADRLDLSNDNQVGDRGSRQVFEVPSSSAKLN